MKLFLVFAIVLCAQDKPPAKCTLSGTVVNAATAEPLGKVKILAEGAGGATPTTTTDAKGRYTLVNLDAGEYHLKAQRNGFLDAAYGARRAGANVTALAVEPGQEIKDLQIKLTPFGVIGGTIRDTDGEPMARITVTVHRLKYEYGKRHLAHAGGAYTDDLGQYRIPDLPPGRYYVVAEAKKAREFGGWIDVETDTEDHSPKGANVPLPLVTTMYPGVQDPAAAGTVEVVAGARVTGVDITLVRSSMVRVRGHVTIPAGMQIGNVSINYAGVESDDLRGRQSTNVNDKGEFEFRQVPPGNYVLMTSAHPPSNLPYGAFEMFQQELKARMPLQVGTNPVEGVRLVMEPGAEVSGHITVEGDDKVKIDSGEVEFAGGPEPILAMIKGEESFKTILSTGHYQVLAARLSRGDIVVRSVTAQGRNVLDGGPTLAEPGKIALEVVMAHEGGSVTGVAMGADEKPVSGATVVLAPEVGKRSRVDLFQQTEADQYGHFSFDGIPPGEYKVFAWDDVEPGMWWDAEFMKKCEGAGEAVTVAVKGKATVKVKAK